METSSLPPDPQELRGPLTPGQRVDEASLESMDASDPPAQNVFVGAPDASGREDAAHLPPLGNNHR